MVLFIDFSGFGEVIVSLNTASLASCFLSLDATRRLTRDGKSDIGLPNVIAGIAILVAVATIMNFGVLQSSIVAFLAMIMTLRAWAEARFTYLDNNRMVTLLRLIPQLHQSLFVVLLICSDFVRANLEIGLLISWLVSVPFLILSGLIKVDLLVTMLPAFASWRDKLLQTLGGVAGEFFRSGPALCLGFLSTDAMAVGRTILLFQLVERFWQVFRMLLFMNVKNYYVSLRRVDPDHALAQLHIEGRRFSIINLSLAIFFLIVYFAAKIVSLPQTLDTSLLDSLILLASLLLGFAFSSGLSVFLEIERPVVSSIFTLIGALCFNFGICIVEVFGLPGYVFGVAQFLRGFSIYCGWFFSNRLQRNT